jgi:hypothetical protein
LTEVHNSEVLKPIKKQEQISKEVDNKENGNSFKNINDHFIWSVSLTWRSAPSPARSIGYWKGILSGYFGR